MNNPYKIIFKYKNANRKIQYNLYIFVGSNLTTQIRNILEKIRNLNFFDSLYSLTLTELKKLEQLYGEEWYEYFYISDHIYYQIELLKKNNEKKKILENKFGKQWTNELLKTETEYKLLEHEFTPNVMNKPMKHPYFKGGDNFFDELEDGIFEEPEFEQEEFNFEDDRPELEVDEFDIEELNDINFEMKDEQKINNILNEIVADTKDKLSVLTKFDKSKNFNLYDDNITNIYQKKYVFSNFIYSNDTIKKIKEKIFISIENNIIHNNNINLPIHSTYLWSKYQYNKNNSKKIGRLSLGHQWISGNDLMKLPVEPNTNISYYENMRGDLSAIIDSINRYGSKIIFKDTMNDILFDYNDYMTMNEIYMMDIYNELGEDYMKNIDFSNERINNVYKTLIRLYFPAITNSHYIDILNYLQNSNNNETRLINNEMIKITNEIAIENEIMDNVNQISNDNKIDLIGDTYITIAVIHTYLSYTNIVYDIGKLDLYRIFDNFIVNKDYPFITLQQPGVDLRQKMFYNFKEINKDMLGKWFENSPYGVNFKIMVNNRYITVNIGESGRLEYKCQWNESDKSTFDEIDKTYQHIAQLIKKINKENNKLQIQIPADKDYKYVFVNTIERFDMEEGVKIDHNQLSDFCRYFFPYFTVVIEPRKRISKYKITQVDKGKDGTYLRYKRISNYDNYDKIEVRILYLMKNFDINSKQLVDQIIKEFNLLEDVAIKFIEKTKQKYPVIKKTRKVLKRIDEIPKYKQPGIAVDIQGRSSINYKIKISGLKNHIQLREINQIMNVILYLYNEVYIIKNKKYIEILDTLKKLTNIAKRKNMIIDMVKKDEDAISARTKIKNLTKLDKERIGYKPKQGEIQWSRACQNSGKIRRQPQQYVDETIDSLLDMGYKYNEQNGLYERKIKKTINGKIKEIILYAANLKTSTGDNIYYTCNPEDNNEYYHLGFLSKSNNPFGFCMPCCFKKNPIESDNEEKRNYHKQCIGLLEHEYKKHKETLQTSFRIKKLYILKDAEKIHANKFSLLPKYLDIFFNFMLNYKRKLEKQYLIEAPNGFFLRFNPIYTNYPFFDSIGVIFNINAEDIKKRIINSLNDNLLFYCNNGNLQLQFKTVDKFKDYIRLNPILNHDLFIDLLSIPGILDKHGINFYIMNKHRTYSMVKNNMVEIDDYVLLCLNKENSFNYYDKQRTNIILLKENDNYYPIFRITKNKLDVLVEKTFGFDDKVIQHLLEYYNNNCNLNNVQVNLYNFDNKYIAKNIFNVLNKHFNISHQFIDISNKCRYLLVNGFLFPTLPSGICLNIDVSYDDKINKYVKSLEKSIEMVKSINEIVKNLDIIAFVFQNVTSAKKYIINGIKFDNIRIMPCEPTSMDKHDLHKLIKKYKLNPKIYFDNRPLLNLIDNDIVSGLKFPDVRMEKISQNKFLTETYNLLKLHLSNYFINNQNMKEYVEDILKNSNYHREKKRYLVRRFVTKILSNDIYNKLLKVEQHYYDNLEVNEPEIEEDLIELYDKVFKEYQLQNIREFCNINGTKDECNRKQHCHFHNNKCKLAIPKDIIIYYINRISEEIIQNGIKKEEILGSTRYYVSDVVNDQFYTERENQKIIKSSSLNKNKILKDIFGENIPIIGKKKLVDEVSADELIASRDNILKVFGNIYQQLIIPGNNTIFRAFANGYFWLNNKYDNVNVRNLGYVSQLQTDLSNFFKSKFIDWANNNGDVLFDYFTNNSNLTKEFFDVLLYKIINFSSYNSSNDIELYVLNNIFDIPIIIYNHNNEIMKMYINKQIKINKFDEDIDKKKSINMKYEYFPESITIDKIYVMYWT